MFLNWLRVGAGIIGCLALCTVARTNGISFPVANNPDSVLFNYGERIGANPFAGISPDSNYSITVERYDFNNSSDLLFFESVSTAELASSGSVEVGRVVWLGGGRKGTRDRNNDSLRTADTGQIQGWPFGARSRSAGAPIELYSELDFNSDTLLATPSDEDPGANDVGIIYGVRGFQVWSNFSIVMLGSVLHDVSVETEADNEILGPQIGFVVKRSAGRFSMHLQATVMAGFNIGEVSHDGFMGRGLVPGALNQPLYARTSEFRHEDRHDEFSPSGELRAEARYRLTDKLTFALAYSGVAIGNALLTDDRMVFYLPDFGLADPGEQNVLVQNVYCGVEFVL